MINKERAKQKVKELVEEFSSISKEELDKKSEFQIQNEFIDPLFEALGWNMRKDAEREKKIFGKRADYIMSIGNQEVAIIEAKKTSITLADEKEGEQAVSYAYHQQIKFAILTNFKQIRVYHALSHTKRINKNLLQDEKGLFWIDYTDFVKEFDRLWLLSKESFKEERINKLLKNVSKRLIKPIDYSILQDLLEMRRILSNDLKNKRTYLSPEQIDEAVQVLIDRLIFMRSVEDRGLEAKDFLLKIKSTAEEGFTDKNLWALLKNQFKRFDKTYNSKLFSEGLLEKGDVFFEKKTLVKTIESLYYGIEDNQARYKFNIIPIDLLGSIYEQYLGVVLRGTEKRVRLDLKSGKRKKMGIYYTPSYIVNYIIKNTVGGDIKNKSIDEILKIRIVDPACGSGSFLVRAFQEVINHIGKRLEGGEKSKHYNHAFQKWEGRLSLGEKATILSNCIYGIDLDEKAVELTQLNLLLKILDEETRETRKRILPNLKDNIKNGNSLIDDSNVAGDKAFNWHAQFPEVFQHGGFDIVVGNPPYFNLQTIKDEKQNNYFQKKYLSYRGKADILYLFIEKDKFLLKEKGSLGIIVANYFLKSHYADKLREIVLEDYKLNKIIDFGSVKIFGDANVDTCIIIASKIKEKNNTYMYGLLKKDQHINEFLRDSLKKNSSLKKDYTIKFYDQNKLTKKPWKFQDNEIKDIILLNKICHIGKGVATGNDKIFVLDQSLAKKLKIEDELIDVLVEDSSIDRYNFRLSKKILIKNKRGVKISKFKNTKEYLEDKKKELQKRYAVRKEGLKWYEIVRYNNDLFSSEVKEQIYVYYRSKYNKFAYSNKRFVTLTTTFVLTLKNKTKINLRYLLGILNSKFMQNYSINNAKKMGDCFEYSSNFIGSIPIKIPSQQQEKEIITLVDQMLKLQKKFHDEKSMGKEKELIKQQIKNVDYEIDQEVYKLYGIIPEEQKIIEET